MRPAARRAVTKRGAWAGPAALAGLFVFGAAAALAWGRAGPFAGVPPGLAASWVQAHPWAAAGVVGAAGFADGLNPCAFTTLLLFIGAVTAAVGQAAGMGDAGARRRHVWAVSGAYMLGIYGLYFGLGLGVLQLAWFRPFAGAHAITRVAGLGAVVLGLLMVREFFVADTRWRVTMPAALHRVARRWTRRTTVGAALVGGVLIGLCTIPCGGGMYLATLGFLAAIPDRLTGSALLAVYNVAFVLPLVLLTAVASARPALLAVARWHVREQARVKLWLGVAVVGLGLAVLALA